MVKSLIIKIRTFFYKDKLFFKDAFLNMMAFAIYICSQQIVLLPALAKLLDENSYANVILFITILNVFSNVLGGQLGVTHQLQKYQYDGKREEEKSDFFILMLLSSLLVVICFPIILNILNYKVLSIVFMTITALVSNYRMYIRYLFRLNSTYINTIVQNIVYFIGVCCGLLTFKFIQISWLPLFIGEIFALVYTIFVIPHKIIKIRKSKIFSKTLKRYSGLGLADALTNVVNLIDKLLVFPLLGAYSLAVYNAGTATSKVAALVMNPLNEVILVKLSKAKDKGASSLLRAVITFSFIFSSALFVILIPLIYVLSFILYRQYLDDIKAIIILLSMGCAVGTTSSVMKNFILRFANPKQLGICYLINLVVIVVCGLYGARMYGLLGFAFAMVIGHVELWISFVVVLFRYSNREENIE